MTLRKAFAEETAVPINNGTTNNGPFGSMWTVNWSALATSGSILSKLKNFSPDRVRVDGDNYGFSLKREMSYN